MPTAEFEEKQYEQPANFELALSHRAVFPAGQVLEGIVGYDVAAFAPSKAPIWRILETDAPRGIQLLPNLWQRAPAQPQAADLPSRYVSLILQYKRPQYLSKPPSKQWDHWRNAYYRFEIEQHQQRTLERLERALSARAAVRYACAAFWLYKELQRHQRDASVLANSAFVPPRQLSGHHTWSYRQAGLTGYANSQGKEVSTECFKDFWVSLPDKFGRDRESLFEHLRGLATELAIPNLSDGAAGPASQDWIFGLSNYLDGEKPSAQVQQGIFDVVEISAQIAPSGASWFVADLDHPDAR